jgi:hypothetical protein
MKESAKLLRTQQQHVHDQRTKDAQVVERSAKLKNLIIVLSFKQKKLRFPVVGTPLGNPRDV